MNPRGLFDEIVQAIETRLDVVLPSESTLSQELVDAMRYAVLGGGKRLRGALVCATTYTLAGEYNEAALNCACALECMHAYSLVHDDLPVMDDADLRRGRPSCHKVYGPAMATLVGDALQPLAFNLVLECDALSARQHVGIAQMLANAAGWRGMVAGQAWDIQITPNSELQIKDLRRLHAAKTGAFFHAAVAIGCVIGAPNPNSDQCVSLKRFATLLGEAFQVVDDILDYTQSSAVTGKPERQDERLGKQTFPALMGLEEATTYANELLHSALRKLTGVGCGDSPLAELAERCVHRLR